MTAHARQGAPHVVVTGARGFIGRALVTKLLDRGCTVTAVDRVVDPEVDPRATPVALDILNAPEDVVAQLGNPTHLIHLAWPDPFVLHAQSHMQQLSQHYEFVMRFFDAGCESISVMGTMHEIGYHEGAVVEDTPCRPLNLYGVAKNALRQALLVRARDSETSLKWLRAYYIVSNSGVGENIFAKIIRADRAGEEWFPFTTGKNQYDFISLEDLTERIAAASLQNDIDGVVNVSSGQPVSLADRIEQFIRDNGLRIQLKYGAFPDRVYDSPVIYGDSERIDRILSAE